MAGALFSWTTSPIVLANNTGAYGKKMYAAIQTIARVFAFKMQSYAQANRVWTDRTGVARATLRGFAVAAATGVVITLAHGASYGIHLELKNSGRFAIIMRTMEAHYGPLMAAIRQMIGG